MIIDRSHRPWIAATGVAFACATALYVYYASREPYGASGGSWQGMLFGISGSMLMVAAGLLAGRKKLPRLPIGSAQAWLKAHIWLGLLSVPLILFHTGFRWGGLVEQVLLVVFALVILSGIVGLIFQQYLPGRMKESTSREAMFEQVPQVCLALRRTADERIVALCGTLFDGGSEAIDDRSREETEKAMLRTFYVTTVRPFLADPPGRSPLENPSQAMAIFSQVGRRLPPRWQGTLAELDAICDERRQLARQIRLHHWLHVWLFVHVPLSLSLLVLGVIHAIASVYY